MQVTVAVSRVGTFLTVFSAESRSTVALQTRLICQYLTNRLRDHDVARYFQLTAKKRLKKTIEFEWAANSGDGGRNTAAKCSQYADKAYMHVHDLTQTNTHMAAALPFI